MAKLILSSNDYGRFTIWTHHYANGWACHVVFRGLPPNESHTHTAVEEQQGFETQAAALRHGQDVLRRVLAEAEEHLP